MEIKKSGASNVPEPELFLEYCQTGYRAFIPARTTKDISVKRMTVELVDITFGHAVVRRLPLPRRSKVVLFPYATRIFSMIT